MPKKFVQKVAKRRPVASKAVGKKSVPKSSEKWTPLRKHLETMTETALVDLLLEISKKHGAVRAELEDRFSTVDQRFAKLETAIARYCPSPSHYDDYGDLPSTLAAFGLSATSTAQNADRACIMKKLSAISLAETLSILYCDAYAVDAAIKVKMELIASEIGANVCRSVGTLDVWHPQIRQWFFDARVAGSKPDAVNATVAAKIAEYIPAPDGFAWE
jgi:hypothetical protein